MKKQKKSRNRKTWMKDGLCWRDTKGAYANILQEFRLNDHENFRKKLRMNRIEEREITGYETRRLWQFSNCTGAGNGKHVTIIHPSSCGSEFF